MVAVMCRHVGKGLCFPSLEGQKTFVFHQQREPTYESCRKGAKVRAGSYSGKTMKGSHRKEPAFGHLPCT